MRTRTFRHSTDIRRDERMADLIAVHGHAGYGVYWMIIEILHSHENMQVDYTEKAVRRLAAQIGMKHQDFHNMLQDMIYDYDLFEVVDLDPAKGQRGYLRSTITYRKPRKQKQPAAIPAETTGTDTPAADNTNSEELPNTNPVDHYPEQQELNPQSPGTAKELNGSAPAHYKSLKPDLAEVFTSP